MNVEVELANVNKVATTLQAHTAVLVKRATDCYLMAGVEVIIFLMQICTDVCVVQQQ